MDPAGPRPQQPVARHGVEHARLPQQHDEHDRRQSGKRADLDQQRRPRLTYHANADHDRVGHVELRVGHVSVNRPETRM